MQQDPSIQNNFDDRLPTFLRVVENERVSNRLVIVGPERQESLEGKRRYVGLNRLGKYEGN